MPPCLAICVTIVTEVVLVTELQVPPGLQYDSGTERFELVVNENGDVKNRKASQYDGPGKRAKLNKPLEVSKGI